MTVVLLHPQFCSIPEVVTAAGIRNSKWRFTERVSVMNWSYWSAFCLCVRLFRSHVQINHKCSLSGVNNSRQSRSGCGSVNIFSGLVPHNPGLAAHGFEPNLIYTLLYLQAAFNNISVSVAAKVNLPSTFSPISTLFVFVQHRLAQWNATFVRTVIKMWYFKVICYTFPCCDVLVLWHRESRVVSELPSFYFVSMFCITG